MRLIKSAGFFVLFGRLGAPLVECVAEPRNRIAGQVSKQPAPPDISLWHAEYPHWQMRSELKAYYLLQLSYWLQQALVMILRLEAPRKDYYELIIHVRSQSTGSIVGSAAYHTRWASLS